MANSIKKPAPKYTEIGNTAEAVATKPRYTWAATDTAKRVAALAAILLEEAMPSTPSPKLVPDSPLDLPKAPIP